MQLGASKIELGQLKKTVIFFSESKSKLLSQSSIFDEKHDGLISKALKNTRFQGSVGEVSYIATPHLDAIDHILVVGLGKVKELTADKIRTAGLKVAKMIDTLGVVEATVVVESMAADVPNAVLAKSFAEGVALNVYRMDQFKTMQKLHLKGKFKKLEMMVEDVAGVKTLIPLIEAQIEGVNLTRDLVNLPPNIANPAYMVKEAKKLSKLGVKVKVLGEKEMEKLGMNMLLAVGRAAKEESQLIIMTYTGDKKSKAKKCIVGKGVMFDTGGYNLKPSAGMAAMKSDMGGAAAVMGTVKALAMRKAKLNIVAVCGCVVNKVGGDGFLPSDILTSYSGKTVEIGNTDAEGRLVLGDALSYILEQEKPDEVIDLATLTGACMVALGANYAGLFSTSNEMSEKLQASGLVTGERLWRMPIDDSYAAETSIADLSNNGRPYGGASTAAVFLKNFVGKTPWAHLDIAGVAMADKIPGGLDVQGASGFGVRLLVDYFDGK